MAKKKNAIDSSNPQTIGTESAIDPQVIRPPRGFAAAQIRRDKMRYPELGPSALAKRAGVTRQAASSVLRTFLSPHSEEQLLDYQQNKADILDAKGFQILESMTTKKIEKMQVRDAAVTYGILFDKRQLVLGQATGINMSMTVLMDVAELLRRDDD